MEGKCPSPAIVKEFLKGHQKTKNPPERVKKK